LKPEIEENDLESISIQVRRDLLAGKIVSLAKPVIAIDEALAQKV
jgi:hypothetical protein